GDVQAAIEQYREILAAAPEHEGALSALESLFARGVNPGAIGDILEPLYRMQDAWDKLIGIQEALLHSQSDPEARVGTLQRIAEIAEQKMGDAGLAFTWMQRALIEDPSHDHSISEAERLAAEVSGWPVLANTLARIVENERRPEIAVALGKRLARIY